MGSPVSPVLANLYMEFFEDRALSTAVNLPRRWERFVDDTFVILKTDHKEEFLQHINSVDPSIQFTTEETKRRWFHALLGHFGHPSGRWNTIHPKYIESLPIQIYICNGIATTIWPASIV